MKYKWSKVRGNFLEGKRHPHWPHRKRKREREREREDEERAKMRTNVSMRVCS